MAVIDKKVGPKITKLPESVSTKKEPTKPEKHADLSPKQLDEMGKNFAKQFVTGITQLGVKRPYFKTDYKWNEEREHVLQEVVEKILNNNEFFQGYEKARSAAAKYVCKRIEQNPELTELFSRKVELALNETKSIAFKKTNNT